MINLVVSALALTLVTLVTLPDSFDDVADALAASGTAAGRSHAAQVLAAVGAHADDGSTDLARAWGHGKGMAYRDRALGPAYRHLALAPRTAVRFGQVFLAGQRARIAIIPDRPGRFSVAVTDEDGASQCQVLRYGRCDWVPLATMRFQIELTNSGSAIVNYYVVLQ